IAQVLHTGMRARVLVGYQRHPFERHVAPVQEVTNRVAVARLRGTVDPYERRRLAFFVLLHSCPQHDGILTAATQLSVAWRRGGVLRVLAPITGRSPSFGQRLWQAPRVNALFDRAPWPELRQGTWRTSPPSDPRPSPLLPPQPPP